MNRLPYRLTTPSGEEISFEFSLHPETESAMRVHQLLECVLRALSHEISLLGETRNGDLLQALAMAMAVRTEMIPANSTMKQQLHATCSNRHWPLSGRQNTTIHWWGMPDFSRSVKRVGHSPHTDAQWHSMYDGTRKNSPLAGNEGGCIACVSPESRSLDSNPLWTPRCWWSRATAWGWSAPMAVANPIRSMPFAGSWGSHLHATCAVIAATMSFSVVLHRASP